MGLLSHVHHFNLYPDIPVYLALMAKNHIEERCGGGDGDGNERIED